MSDLISRKALLDKLKYFSDMYTLDEEAKVVLEAFVKIVTEQPTAYDVEKVVAELNEATIKIAQKYLDMVDGKETQSIATYNEFVLTLLNRIMKQIRRGDVE